MEEQASTEKVAKPKSKWADRLRGRARMAVAAIGGMTALGLICVANPMLDRIAVSRERLKKADARATLASDVSKLRKQAELYGKKLPHGVDLNDWTEYLLTGIRSEPVKLVRMDPKDQVSIGPCKVLSWSIELEGDFASFGRVVAWMENGERLVRLDQMAMQLPNGKLSMFMVVRGLAVDKPEQPKVEKSGKPTTKPATATKPTTRKAGKS